MRHIHRGTAPDSSRKEPDPPPQERDARVEGDEGYVLALVTIGIFAILVLVGLVVDVGGWYSKASKEQRAADAAALAGAQTFAATGSWDAAVAEAERTAAQNGYTSGGDFSVTVSQVGDTGVKVVVKESNVELFFAQLVTSNVDIERGAVATPAGCGAECDQDITLGKPFQGISVAAEGDGFSPTLVGTDKVFALNHHVPNPGLKSMLCIERDTSLPCDGYPKTVNAYTSFTSELAYHPGLNALYYSHQTASDVRVGCWSVTTDASCGTAVLAALPLGTRDQHSQTRSSSPVIIGSNAWVQTDDYNMHCVVLASLSPCAGSPFTATSFTAARDAGTMPVDSHAANAFRQNWRTNNTFNIDTEVLGSKLYHVIALRRMTNPAFNDGSYIGCFDTATNAPCAGFDQPTWVPVIGGAQASDAAWRNHPYLFVRQTTGMVPSGICVHDAGDHGCVNLAGGNQARIGGFNGHLDKSYGKTHTSAEAHLGSKTFFPDQQDNTTRCWNWATSSGCGEKDWGTSVDASGVKQSSDYGYASDGNCIFALGHTTLFWSFDENFERCFGGSTAVEINPCICSTGEPVYGSLQIPEDVLAELDSASATVTSIFGTTLIGETDLIASGGFLDMSGISTAEGSVILELEVRSDSYELGGDVWENAISASANVVTRPVLVD